MAISDEVQSQLFVSSTAESTVDGADPQVIRVPPTRPAVTQPQHLDTTGAPSTRRHSQQGTWTRQEHERFLEGLTMFPSGPWKAIASHVGTKTPRQAMTHAQKYRQKIQRRQRGLKKTVRDRPEEEDDEVAELEGALAGSLPLLSEAEFTAFLDELDLSDEELFTPSPDTSRIEPIDLSGQQHVGPTSEEVLDMCLYLDADDDDDDESTEELLALNSLRESVFANVTM